MLETKKITMDGRVVGRAEINIEGMYYVIRCFCTLQDPQLRTVLLSQGESTMEIGVCVPQRTGANLVKRIRKDAFNMDNVCFSLALPDAISTNDEIVLQPGMPINHIDKLDSMVFQEDGTVHLRVDQRSSN